MRQDGMFPDTAFSGGEKPRPGIDVMRRVEELLREEMLLLGVDVAKLEPHEIALGMRCGVHPDGSLSYMWKGAPLLDVEPEKQPDGTVVWRFFTRDTPVQ